MKWIRKLRSRRAVSPVIAALLLIAISVAAAVITYSWVTSMIKSQGTQAQTSIRIEDVQFDVTTTLDVDYSEIKITIRNTGGVVAVIQTLYIYDGDTQFVKQDEIGIAIMAGELKAIGFTEHASTWQSSIEDPDELIEGVTFDSDFETSHAYAVKLVTDNGFTVEGTFYSPSSWS